MDLRWLVAAAWVGCDSSLVCSVLTVLSLISLILGIPDCLTLRVVLPLCCDLRAALNLVNLLRAPLGLPPVLFGLKALMLERDFLLLSFGDPYTTLTIF
jgi:ABC-type tungstate transport system substrate-binding protein